jgi:hypothetical protein
MRAAEILSALSLLFATVSCATIQEPPGGPRDFTPPELLQVKPDSGATVPGLKDAAVFQFSEVIAERPGAPLDQMVLLSPRPKGLEVAWHRSSFTVKPRDGWQPGVVYRLTLLPGITDLRNNKLNKGRTLVFSTGGEIPSTRIEGRVIDWEAGSAAARAVVEAVRMPDSLVYWDVADSVGNFSMIAVPPGKYILFATIDKNNNRKHDSNESFDSTTIALDSAVTRTFWTFAHDTIGPRLRNIARVDSVTVRAEFNQSLKPGNFDSTAFTLTQLPDSTPVRLAGIYTTAVFDSIQAAARAESKPDSTRRGGPARPGNPAVLNQPAAPGGLVGAQPAPAPTGRPPVSLGVQRPGAPGRPGGPGAAPVDSAVIKLLKDRPKLSSTAVLRTSQPLAPGTRYVVRARVTNPSGATGESTSVLVIPAAADTTKKPMPAPKGNER